METILYKSNTLTLLISLFTSLVTTAQDFAYSSQVDMTSGEKNRIESSERSEDFTTFLFLNALVSTNHFNYRRTLKQAKQNPITISIGVSTIQSPKLLKVLKEAARKSNNVETFTAILSKKQLDLANNVTDGQIRYIYTSFRSSTFNGLLDELRSSFTHYQ